MYAAISIDAEVPVSFNTPGDIDDIISVSEKHNFPITWLIYSSITRPQEVVRHYHDRVIPRLPAGHEVGLHVHFDDHNLENYETDPATRRKLILRGAEILRKYDVTPTSFRAGCWCLQWSDVEVLEEAGLVVDSSPCTGFRSMNHPGHGDWRNLSLRDPYHPSYSSLLSAGDAKLLVIPVCSSITHNASGWCDCGYLEYRGWHGLEPILRWYAEQRKFISMGTHDGRKGNTHPPSEVMDKAVPYLRERGYEFTTLTQMAKLWIKGKIRE